MQTRLLLTNKMIGITWATAKEISLKIIVKETRRESKWYTTLYL